MGQDANVANRRMSQDANVSNRRMSQDANVSNRRMSQDANVPDRASREVDAPIEADDATRMASSDPLTPALVEYSPLLLARACGEFQSSHRLTRHGAMGPLYRASLPITTGRPIRVVVERIEIDMVSFLYASLPMPNPVVSYTKTNAQRLQTLQCRNLEAETCSIADLQTHALPNARLCSI
jgi:hypothetical protein